MKTTFTSPNISGKEWINRLEKEHYKLGDRVKEILEKIIPTKNSYTIVILKMDRDYYTTQQVRDEAQKRGYITPPLELAPILREQISDKEIEDLGLWWLIVAHESIPDSVGDPVLLGLLRRVDGHWLRAYWDYTDVRWFREVGFVFLAPQVGTQPSEISSLEPQSFDPFHRRQRHRLGNFKKSYGDLQGRGVSSN